MKAIQVFEHQTLKVGQTINGVVFKQRYFELLTKLPKSKFFQLLHNGIRFRQYVGALQVGDLVIEILPKADRYSKDSAKWRNVLVQMLRYCKLLKINTLQTASLRPIQHSILEIYYEIFLDELEYLLHHGLYSTYTPTAANRKSLKGKLQFEKQLTINLIRKDRFYTQHYAFSLDNPFNQILKQSLAVLRQVELPQHLSSRLAQVHVYFSTAQISTFKRIKNYHFTYNRQNAHYQAAIDIAQLLLNQEHPDLRAGEQQLVALLFDMNLLFEEYIYRQLLEARTTSIQIKRQQQLPFWEQRFIRPDIVIEQGEKKYVLDTKWKILTNTNPPMSDIQQAFIYCQYFQAQQTHLIYPRVGQMNDMPPKSFKKKGNQESCAINFAPVLMADQLNLNLGKTLLSKILN